MKNIVIYGAGSVGRLAAQIISDINKRKKVWQLLGFLDDNAKIHGTTLPDGTPVLGDIRDTTFPKDTHVVIAFSRPVLKEELAKKIEKSHLIPATIIHPTAWISDRVEIGEGSVIYPHVCIDCDVIIGKHTTINKAATLGHDSTYGDFGTISPGVNLGGFLQVGKNVEFGIGSCTIQFITIGAHATIGAGAVIIKNVAEGKTMVGNPGREVGN